MIKPAGMNKSASVIRAARRHWGLGDSPVTLVAARENAVYRVDGPEGPTALRLHRQGYRSASEIESELQWMDMLASSGIAVPTSVVTTDGTTVQNIDGVLVDMLSWVDGVPLSKVEVTEEVYHELGRVLAQMHQLADVWSPPAAFNRPTWDLTGDHPSWDRFWENPKLTPAQSLYFQQFREQAMYALEHLTSADTGLIHADLVPDNVLYNDRQLQIIDFDDGGFGYRLFDMATITHRCRCRHGSEAFAEATVAGYCGERQLDMALLPLFEALRACSYVGWNISRMHEAGGPERNERFVAEAIQAINFYTGAA